MSTTESQGSSLALCPFCGGDPEIMTSPDGFTSIGCLKCNPVFGVMVQRRTRKEAVELWNTRAEQETHDVSDQPLRFMCDACGGVSLEIAPSYCPCCGRKVVER